MVPLVQELTHRSFSVSADYGWETLPQAGWGCDARVPSDAGVATSGGTPRLVNGKPQFAQPGVQGSSGGGNAP
jgi:hypothetical protein